MQISDYFSMVENAKLNDMDAEITNLRHSLRCAQECMKQLMSENCELKEQLRGLKNEL